MLALLETRLQTDWQRQQQNSLNLTSPPHTKKSRPFWNRSRNQPGDKKNNGYDPQKDQINALDRRTQTTIFRLRTGHCRLRKHLKSLADSAHCECGSKEQTPEHILQTCPHLETVHQQFWPEDTEVGTKLWGQAAKLQRTADFLAATGLRISTVITSNAEEEEESWRVPTTTHLVVLQFMTVLVSWLSSCQVMLRVSITPKMENTDADKKLKTELKLTCSIFSQIQSQHSFSNFETVLQSLCNMFLSSFVAFCCAVSLYLCIISHCILYDESTLSFYLPTHLISPLKLKYSSLGWRFWNCLKLDTLVFLHSVLISFTSSNQSGFYNFLIPVLKIFVHSFIR